jgi:hypothetical protein
MGRAMPDYIRSNKLEIFGLLEAIDNGVASGDHDTVKTCRENLSLLARLEITRNDELTLAVRKVFDLTGRWDRTMLSDGGLAEIAPAVEDAIRLLNT